MTLHTANGANHSSISPSIGYANVRHHFRPYPLTIFRTSPDSSITIWHRRSASPLC